MTIVKDLFYVAVLFVCIMIAFYLGTRHETLEEKMSRYNCSLSEFVPDIPTDVRNECRRRVIERINQEKGQ